MDVARTTAPRTATRRAALAAAVVAALCLLCLAAWAGPARAAAKSHPYNLGCKALAAGDLTEATKLFKQAVALEPEDTDALNNLAVCYLQSGEFDKADALLRKVLELNPKYRGADLNIGAGFILKGEPSSGEESTKKATDAPPTPNGKAVEASAYYNLGLIAAAAGDYAGAQADLEKCAGIKPDAQTYAALGCVQGAQGDWDAGVASLQKAAGMKTRDALYETVSADLAAAFFGRGMAKLQDGDVAGARVDFTASKNEKPNDYAAMGLALVAAEEGDEDAARATLTGLKTSTAAGVADAAAANLAKLKSSGGGSRGGGSAGTGGWLSWLVLAGGGVLFAVQTFAVLRAAATRPRTSLSMPLAGLGAVVGVVTAAVFALSYFGSLDGSTFVLAALAVDVVVVVLTLAAPALGRGRTRTA